MQVKDLRERLDSTGESLRETETKLRESGERGRERGEEAERLQTQAKEAAANVQELKVNTRQTSPHFVWLILCLKVQFVCDRVLNIVTLKFSTCTTKETRFFLVKFGRA